MLSIHEKVDDEIEEWNLPNITYETFYDLCDYYTKFFIRKQSTKYKNAKEVTLQLFNSNKLLLTFNYKNHTK